MTWALAVFWSAIFPELSANCTFLVNLAAIPAVIASKNVSKLAQANATEGTNQSELQKDYWRHPHFAGRVSRTRTICL